jgi:hypothetical protein
VPDRVTIGPGEVAIHAPVILELHALAADDAAFLAAAARTLKKFRKASGPLRWPMPGPEPKGDLFGAETWRANQRFAEMDWKRLDMDAAAILLPDTVFLRGAELAGVLPVLMELPLRAAHYAPQFSLLASGARSRLVTADADYALPRQALMPLATFATRLLARFGETIAQPEERKEFERLARDAAALAR